MTFKHVRPAKARTFDKKRDGYLLSAVTPKNTVAEVKRNGWRFAITSEKSYSATGKAMNTFVQKCIPEGYAIDGEIAFEDFSKRPGDVSHALSERNYEGLYFYAFDVLQTPGLDQKATMALSFGARRQVLELLYHKFLIQHDKFKLNEVFHEDFPGLVEMLKEQGAEGAIFKNTLRPYEPGGRANMVKLKFFDDYDVVIVDALGKPTEWTVRPGETGKDGVFYPKGKHAESWEKEWVNLRYGMYDIKTGKLVTLGSLGVTGPKEKMEKHIGKVALMKAYDLFPTGCLQHPVWLDWRDPADKAAKDCLFDFEKGVLA